MQALSSCCGAQVTAVGTLTWHWECGACGNACDAKLSDPFANVRFVTDADGAGSGDQEG